MKICSKCGISKSVDEYQKNKARPDGLTNYCRECNNSRLRAAYAKNPEAKIARTRKYHLENAEWSKRTLAEWHQNNKLERANRVKERLESDPEFREYRRALVARKERERRAQKAGSEFTKISPADYAKILEEYNSTCWICELPLTDIHWDHVKPLAKGGAHVVDNLRPACPACNVRKNALFPFTEEMKKRIADEVRSLQTNKEVLP